MSVMKLNVITPQRRFVINVETSSSILKVKQIIANALNVSVPSTTDGNETKTKTDEFLHLYHNKTPLLNNCTLKELSLTSGATLRCEYIRTMPYTLKIHVPCISKDLILRKEINLERDTVEQLRTIIQNRTGLPVSSFVLHKDGDDMTLFDKHILSFYGIGNSDMLIAKVWKTCEKVIVNALSGDMTHTMLAVPSFLESPILNRFCLRIALFVAAHMDYLNLAKEVVQSGIRPDEAVSEHPYRQWCIQQSHPDVHKTPVHQSASQGSYRTLSFFLRHRPTCIVAKDGNRLPPSTHALRNRHLECWKLLTVIQFQFHSVYGFSVRIHAKILKWYYRAKDRILHSKVSNRKQRMFESKLSPILNSCFGQPILLNGYHNHMHEKDVLITLERAKSQSHQRDKSASTSSMRVRTKSAPSIRQKNKDEQDRIVRKTTCSTIDISWHKLDLPAISNVSKSKPLASKFVSPHQRARSEAMKMIYQSTGKTSAEIAQTSFEKAQQLQNVKWNSRMKIAMKCSQNLIIKDGNANELKSTT